MDKRTLEQTLINAVKGALEDKNNGRIVRPSSHDVSDKYTSLDDYIEEQLKDEEFAANYKKESQINNTASKSLMKKISEKN